MTESLCICDKYEDCLDCPYCRPINPYPFFNDTQLVCVLTEEGRRAWKEELRRLEAEDEERHTLEGDSAEDRCLGDIGL